MRLNEIKRDFSKWWYNARTGKVLGVPRAHGDMTANNPDQFGITSHEIEKIKKQWPDVDDWWDFLRYEAQKKRWVRIGVDLNQPYIWAASLPDARKAALWMVNQNLISDELDIEINDPENPTEGHGDFYQLSDKQLDLFIRRGIISR